MNMSKSMGFMDRWHALAKYCVLGKQYRITCFDGSVYQGNVINVYDADDDVEVLMNNIRDLSADPKFDDCKALVIGSIDIASVEEVA